MLTRLLAVAVLLAAPVFAYGQTLADKVPGDAIVYIGWAGGDSLGPDYAGSHLKALLDASNAHDLIDKTIPQLVDKLDQQNPQGAQALRLIGSIADPMWRHPSAIYMEPMDFSKPRNPQPRVGLICDAGTDADALKAQVDRLVAQAGHTSTPIVVIRDQNLIRVVIGPSQIEAGKIGMLSAESNFTMALAQVSKDSIITAYVNVDNLVGMLDDAVQHAPDPSAKLNCAKLRDALGLGGIHRIIKTGRFDGAEWSVQAFVAAPAPRSGVLPSLLDAKPLSDDLLTAVPVSATSIRAGHFDLGGLWDAIYGAITKANPDSQAMIDGGIDQLNQMAGVNIRQDLFGSLGDQWVAYAAPTVGGNGLLGTVLVNPLKDAAKADQAISSVAQTIANIADQQLHGAPIHLAFKQIKVGDDTVHYLATPLISPAWEIRDGKLFAGLYPQVVIDAADFAGSHDKSILDNETFKATRMQLKEDDVKPVALSFIDLPKTAPDSYQMLLALSRLYTGAGDMLGVDVPPMLVPPLSKLEHELTPAMTLVWVDDSGMHGKSITPFPGANLMGSQEGMILANEGVLISVLLPSLNHARAGANGVKSSSNLRQIGEACLIYANDNKQNYPPDLGTLFKDEGLSPNVCISPFHEGATPAAPDDSDKLADWVNANSDYVYLAAGKTTSMDATKIVAYEKSGLSPNGRSAVLYGDGHVDSVPGDVLSDQLNAQK